MRGLYQMETVKQVIDGLNYAKLVLNALPVNGKDNCQMIINAVTNIDVFFELIERGEIELKESKNKDSE